VDIAALLQESPVLELGCFVGDMSFWLANMIFHLKAKQPEKKPRYWMTDAILRPNTISWNWMVLFSHSKRFKGIKTKSFRFVMAELCAQLAASFKALL
jgi:hypothetical protein